MSLRNFPKLIQRSPQKRSIFYSNPLQKETSMKTLTRRHMTLAALTGC